MMHIELTVETTRPDDVPQSGVEVDFGADRCPVVRDELTGIRGVVVARDVEHELDAGSIPEVAPAAFVSVGIAARSRIALAESGPKSENRLKAVLSK